MPREVPLTVLVTDAGVLVVANDYTLTFYDVQRFRQRITQYPGVRHVARVDNNAVLVKTISPKERLANELREELSLMASVPADALVTLLPTKGERRYHLAVVPAETQPKAELAWLADALVGLFDDQPYVGANVLAIKKRYLVVGFLGNTSFWPDWRALLGLVPLDIRQLTQLRKDEVELMGGFKTLLERRFPN